jgi:hypothetical protein
MPRSMEISVAVESVVLAITHLGSGPGVVSLALLYTWWVDPAGGRKLGVLLGISWLLNLTLKELLAWPRPFQVDPESASSAARATAYGPGFPSGHAQATATFWFFLAFHHQRRWLFGVAVAAVALVGWSRVWLGVHFPLDVLGGVVVGLALAWSANRAPEPGRLGLWTGPLLILAVFPVVLLGERFAEAAGLTVGMVVAPGDHRVPRTRGRRLLVAAGGLAVLWGIYVLAEPLLARSPALWLGGAERVPAATWGGYLRAALLTLFAFGLWPRWVLGRYRPGSGSP